MQPPSASILLRTNPSGRVYKLILTSEVFEYAAKVRAAKREERAQQSKNANANADERQRGKSIPVQQMQDPMASSITHPRKTPLPTLYAFERRSEDRWCMPCLHPSFEILSNVTIAFDGRWTEIFTAVGVQTVPAKTSSIGVANANGNPGGGGRASIASSFDDGSSALLSMTSTSRSVSLARSMSMAVPMPTAQWFILVHECMGDLCVGVLLDVGGERIEQIGNADSFDFCDHDIGWGFHCDGFSKHEQSYERYGRRFGAKNDVIAVELNVEHGTLAFSVNGQSFGAAFADLPTVTMSAASAEDSERVNVFDSGKRCSYRLAVSMGLNSVSKVSILGFVSDRRRPVC